MLYLPGNADYAQKQQDFYHKQVDDRPKSAYGVPQGFDYLNQPLYEKLPARGYGEDAQVTHILPFLNCRLLPEGTPGLRGVCYPTLREIFIRFGDVDSDRVIDHEHTHLGLHLTYPYHREHEVREIENWRHGHETYH